LASKGTILNNGLIPAKKTREYHSAKGLPEPQGGREAAAPAAARPNGLLRARVGRRSEGNFLNAAKCSEAIALAGATIR
jgi:hypothetical protein